MSTPDLNLDITPERRGISFGAPSLIDITEWERSCNFIIGLNSNPDLIAIDFYNVNNGYYPVKFSLKTDPEIKIEFRPHWANVNLSIAGDNFYLAIPESVDNFLSSIQEIVLLTKEYKQRMTSLVDSMLKVVAGRSDGSIIKENHNIY